jgi:hypothetical protein
VSETDAEKAHHIFLVVEIKKLFLVLEKISSSNR